MVRPIVYFTTLLLTSAAYADDYPDKTITIVSPYGAGGTTDIIARQVASALTAKLGVTAIVENRTGGSAVVGTASVARSAPDGYTLLVAGSAHGINNTIRDDVPYDPVKDFEPVALLFKLPHALIVNPSVPVKTVQEFIEYAKQNPTAIQCGVTPNTSNELATVMFSTMTGVTVSRIAYQGDAQIMRDILGGHINCFNGIANQVLPYLNGEVKVLATTGAERIKALADVPTLIESGLTNYEAASWNGIFVPAGTPKPVIDKLSQAILEMANDPAFKKKWEDIGAVVTPSGPDGLREHLADEIARWTPIAAEMKAQAPK